MAASNQKRKFEKTGVLRPAAHIGTGIPRDPTNFSAAIATIALLAITAVHAAENDARLDSGLRTTTSSMTPVWLAVAGRYSQREILQKIVELAERPLVAPEEIERTFGIQFDAPTRDKGSTPFLIYNVKSNATAQIGSASDHFSFFYEEGKRWTLRLAGFSAGLPKELCVPISEVLKTILDRGWIAKREDHADRVVVFYDRYTPAMGSRLYLGNVRGVKSDSCFGYIQISNGAR